MGSSSTPSHTTQTTEPPAFIRPYMQYGADEARNLYGTGGPQYYGGNTVVPFSQQTEQALGRTEQRALAGSPVNQAAQQYATGILGGTPTSQFGGASNPHLDAVFNRGADAITSRIQSDFAGSGRNIEAGAPLAADQLGSLYAGVYAPAYENERNRMAQDIEQQRALQFSAAGLAPTLAEQDYRDIGALGNVGAQVEDLTGRLMEDSAARWDFSQNAPQMNLDNYLARITGAYPGGTSTGTTPTYRNRSAGALGGAASLGGLAAALGASGPVGWGLAGLGGLLGAYG